MVRLLIPMFDSHPWLATLPLPFIGSLLSDVDTREGVEQSENIEEPQHDANHHDCVQDRLDTACHGYETIYQPQEDAHYDQGYENLNERHTFLPFCLSCETLLHGPQEFHKLCTVRCGECVRPLAHNEGPDHEPDSPCE
jgi:hypothetical protein